MFVGSVHPKKFVKVFESLLVLLYVEAGDL
jgi:hypothetical protein